LSTGSRLKHILETRSMAPDFKRPDSGHCIQPPLPGYVGDGAYCCKAFLGGASMGETGRSVKEKRMATDDNGLALSGVARAPEEGGLERIYGLSASRSMASMV
jgi:hypothetical protein